jgi:hypothetical protein
MPPELPALTEKLVTVPSKGACSSGLEIEENGRKVHVPLFRLSYERARLARRSPAIAAADSEPDD